jgi:anti-anti-sigma factor
MRDHAHRGPGSEPLREVTPVLPVTVHVADVVTVRVAGEVDAHTAPLFAAALRAGYAAVEHHDSLVVDLTDVRFFSAAGLTQLLTTRQRCRERRLPLLVVAPDSVLRPLRLTRLDDLFDLVAPAPHRTRRGHAGPRRLRARGLPATRRAVGSTAPSLINPCRRG